MNPRIGYHVRALDFRFLLGGRGLGLGLGIEDFELLEKAATESEHFIAARANCSICHNEWIDGRKHLDESNLLALPLPLLPKITTLTVPPPRGDQDCLSSMIANASQSKDLLLPQLRSLCLEFPYWSGDNALKTIRPYAELPSLRLLSIVNWFDGPWTRQVKPQLYTNITALELWSCNINFEGLSKVLRQFRLRIFAYSCSFDSWRFGAIDFSLMHQALREASCFTLQSFS